MRKLMTQTLRAFEGLLMPVNSKHKSLKSVGYGFEYIIRTTLFVNNNNAKPFALLIRAQPSTLPTYSVSTNCYLY